MTHLLPIRASYWAVTALSASALGSLLCITLMWGPLHPPDPPAAEAPDCQPVVTPKITLSHAGPVVPAPPPAFTAHPDEYLSGLPFSLLATLEVDDPRQSQATLLDERSGSVRMYNVGNRLEPNVLVVGIEDGRVHLVHAGQPERLNLSREPNYPPGSKHAAYRPELDRALAGIHCTGLECTVSRAFVHQVLANPNWLLRSARVVPAVKDGVSTGVKLYGVRRDSIPKLLGFKNGDLVTAVNGHPLHHMRQAMDAYVHLRQVSRVEFDVVREGKALRLVLLIK